MPRFILVLALLTVPASAVAKDYSAERFDVTIRTLDDGSIQVTETVRFTFDGGPFTYVSREIPLGRTDGIEVLGASMDGRVLRRGQVAAQFEVRTGNNKVLVRWHFAPVTGGAHDFRLSYVARGVARQADAGHVLEWQALPGEHSYAIASSRIVLQGAAADRAPAIRSRRVAGARSERTDRGWAIEARGIARNGWIAISSPVALAADIVPKWQARERRQRARAPLMIQLGVLAFIIATGAVVLVWRQYPAPPILDEPTVADRPPSHLPPAIAAAVAAGGRSVNAHAPGTLFDLAARSALTIAEAERGWKPGRRFVLNRTEGTSLAPHESALLDVMFSGEARVDFRTAANRLTRRGRLFRHAVNEELRQLGLTDEHRRATRRRLIVLGVMLPVLSLGAAVFVVAGDLGPWALAIPIGLDLAAALALILGFTRAELSDEGFRERARWRAFRKGVKASLGSGAALQYLPYIAALGLGGQLARELKKHGENVALPPWFRTLAGTDGSVAFAAFVGSTAASTGGGASSAGTAGGGASGAG